MADVTAVPVVPEDKPGPTVDELLALLARIDQMHERVTRDLAAWDAEAARRETDDDDVIRLRDRLASVSVLANR